MGEVVHVFSPCEWVNSRLPPQKSASGRIEEDRPKLQPMIRTAPDGGFRVIRAHFRLIAAFPREEIKRIACFNENAVAGNDRREAQLFLKRTGKRLNK